MADKSKMIEHPILMSGPMVRAILEGQKTQTRRVVKPQPSSRDGEALQRSLNIRPVIFVDGGEKIRCPYGQPGDRLWVRETFQLPETDKGYPASVPTYYADIPDPEKYRPWRPSIFMPRWASRITLEITNIRVERVQEITAADAIAEGAIEWATSTGFSWKHSDKPYPVFAFQHLWDSINAKRGFGWDKNPWVWVIEFKKAAPGPITSNE